MSVDLSKMSDNEKEAYIDAIELAIDYGNNLTDEEFELYNLLIAERSQRLETSNEKDTLDSVIEAAEKRHSEQNEINTDHIGREAR